MVTDRFGKFSFKTGQKLPVELVVSFVGYQPLELTAKVSPVEISLQESQSQLNEVVVIG